MTDSTGFIVIPANEFDLRKGEIILRGDEAELLLENQSIIVKWLQKSKFAYQISLSTGKFKGSEEKIYRAMEVCDELIEKLKSIETGFKEYFAKIEAAKAIEEEKKRKRREEEEPKVQ